ncbi:hypothetical protein [Acinetobacter chinensis]|uniref:hypothetical protein n=1 Tax=Acinetobacter chinensis TaxID=2004650 RepID=UPI002934F658|nr:hypothetical protein [Acinetobacter chinensis]WOE40072.1 hypothetical protein QSG87_09115 [Acinetobacter chinensis]
MSKLNLTRVTEKTPYIKKIKTALEKAAGQKIVLTEIRKVIRKSGVSVLPVLLSFTGGQELILYVRASADVIKAELNGKETVLSGDFSDDYKITFDNAVSGIAKVIRNSQSKVEQQNKRERVKLPPRKASHSQQMAEYKEQESAIDAKIKDKTAQRDQLLEKLNHMKAA